MNLLLRGCVAQRVNLPTMSMKFNTIDPLADNRWDDFVSTHPRASVFHQTGWLRALSCTYGYKPFVLTSTPPGQVLQDGTVVCPVRSWITGSRLVSVPFADHCDPLLDDAKSLQNVIKWLQAECARSGYRYVELRPIIGAAAQCPGLLPGSSFYFHELDLRSSTGKMFDRLHKDSIQRKLRRAERERLSCTVGRSNQLLSEFYQLLLITRRRHQVPPQPRLWFQSLAEYMGDKLQIRVAKKDDRPIAALLTVRHGSTVVYKYGCSDERWHALGAMPFLLWGLIRESKDAGAETIDLGRTDLDNGGLSTFKDRFGARKTILTYYRYCDAGRQRRCGIESSLLGRLIPFMPDAALRIAGRVLYKHMG